MATVPPRVSLVCITWDGVTEAARRDCVFTAAHGTTVDSRYSSSSSPIMEDDFLVTRTSFGVSAKPSPSGCTSLRLIEAKRDSLAE
jgi:hypothetical protein